MSRLKNILLIGIAGLAAPVMAQSDIDPINKFCWQENGGWMNWRDAGGGQDGVREQRTFLSGFIWAENLGWVNLGHTPADGIQHANTTGGDYGVNIDMQGLLSGFAWSENAGWVNFSGGGLASPPNPARLDLASQRLRGYVWGENIGWVNLNLPFSGQYVQRVCYANCDQSTTAPVLSANDFQCFLNAFASGDAAANCDRSTVAPVLTANDFQCFLNAFSARCP